ncbi:cobaltochelatase CobT-related protein [Brevibacterium sp. CFH 10365]|uniref:cobaltochelatase CobT-related protein n=1 Tax=Brevibacterium sp. CFH 10365 TaxID=2585207 RepID=UPI0012661357|nr:cobalt chelatase [Brevibacterium sp. CFH 10365]
MTTHGPQSSTQRSDREELVLERRLAAVFRALSQDAGVDLWAHRPADANGLLPMNAPHLYPDPSRSDLTSLRGATDAMAMRRKWSDPELHGQQLPQAREERLLVEILEQFRCESLARQAGVRANLSQRNAHWRSEYLRSRLHETHLGMLLYTVIVVTRSILTGEPIGREDSDLLEESRFELSSELGPFLIPLRNARHDQQTFAEVARELAHTLAGRIAAVEEREGTRSGARERRAAPSLPLVFDIAEDLFAPAPEDSGGQLHLARGYRVWTTRFDRESTIAEVVRTESLRSGRTAIAAETARRSVPLAPVVSRLHGVVEAVKDAHELVDSEDGFLDSSRLTRLITSPGDPRVFRGRSQRAETDCAVTFLLDLSGSMKPHALGLGALLDVLVTALDRLDVSTEILGFTTNAWNGGRVRNEWKRAGSPDRPGRLNELHHLVMKSGASSWRRTRSHLGGLLKTSLFREGVDAEALRWAVGRLRSQQAAKSAVVVISDGLPADSATAFANDEDYLARDLETTVAGLRRAGDIGTLGVGIGTDPGLIYPASVELDAESLGDRASVRSVVDGLRTVLAR